MIPPLGFSLPFSVTPVALPLFPRLRKTAPPGVVCPPTCHLQDLGSDHGGKAWGRRAHRSCFSLCKLGHPSHHSRLHQWPSTTFKMLHFKTLCLGLPQVFPWLRLCPPNAGGPGLISGQGTRSRISVTQINKYLQKYFVPPNSSLYWLIKHALLRLDSDFLFMLFLLSPDSFFTHPNQAHLPAPLNLTSSNHTCTYQKCWFWTIFTYMTNIMLWEKYKVANHT